MSRRGGTSRGGRSHPDAGALPDPNESSCSGLRRRGRAGSRRAALLAGVVTLLVALAPQGGGAARAADDLPDDLETFCVRVARAYTGRPGEVIAPALIVVSQGKVVAVLPPEQAVTPAEVPVIDRRDLVAMPGLVACGLWTGSGQRAEETAGARYRAIDGFDPYTARPELLRAGITTAFLNPGRGRLVSGEGAVVKLGGPAVGRVVRESAGMCVDLGETAVGPPPKMTIPVPSSSDVPIVPAERQRPTSRVGLLAELEARLRNAVEYETARAQKPAAERPKHDPDLEAIAATLALGADGTFRIDVRRAPEILGAVELAWDLGLRPVFSGLTEASEPQVMAALAALDAPCVYEMPLWLRSGAWNRGEHPDRIRVRADTPRRLAEAGVSFALSSPPGSEEELRLLAAMAVRGGLDPGVALSAVTRQAARVLGVADRVGTLEPGRDADFVLLAGEPLGTRTEVVETWVGGHRAWRAPPSETVIVRAGTVLTCAGEPITGLLGGEVLIERGQISAVGSSVAHPRGARVIDAGPRGVVTPGLIDAYGHLGLSGDTSAPAPDLLLHGLIARSRPPWLDVARAGVTTVLMAPWNVHGQGSRIVAIKTAEGVVRDPKDLRGGLVLREVAGVTFLLNEGDPLVVPASLSSRLQTGKAYAATWEKYRADLAKWVADEAKRRLEGRSEGRAGERREAREARKREDEPTPQPKADPISGIWTTTMSGGPLPRAEQGELALRLDADGTTIQGIARSPQAPGQEVPVAGTLKGKSVVLTVEVDSPVGAPRIEAELDSDDHMRGKVRAGPFEIDFEATRTVREAPELKVVTRRRGAKGSRPTPPPIDHGLEPLRLAFEKRAVLVLHGATALGARVLLDHLDRLGLRVVFVGMRDPIRVADRLRKSDASVLVRPEALVRPAPGAPEEPQALALARAGVRISYLSGAEDGAAELPLRAVLAVSRGQSWTSALSALTIDAARAYGLDDRVGSLEVGKDGDLVVWDGPPLEATSRVVAVVVGGRVIDLAH